MSESDDAMEAVERLERALERIAERAAQSATQPAAAPSGAELAEIAQRLDAAIARLREGLGVASE